MKKMKLGLALSGGGARGIAHIGVLKALDENNIKPSVISGVSMGALVAVSYGLGIDYDELLYLVKKGANPLKLKSLSFRKQGIFDLDIVREVFEEKAEKDDFSILKIPTFITVTNFNTGKFEIVSKGKFIDYTLASASIPLLFTPVKIGNSIYVDGGLTKNMAAQAIAPFCDKVIGVHVNHIGYTESVSGIKEIASRTFHLAVYNTILNELDYCDFLIDPPATANYGVLDFNKADEIFELGYEEGLKLAEQLQSDQNILKQAVVKLKKAIMKMQF